MTTFSSIYINHIKGGIRSAASCRALQRRTRGFCTPSHQTLWRYRAFALRVPPSIDLLLRILVAVSALTCNSSPTQDGACRSYRRSINVHCWVRPIWTHEDHSRSLCVGERLSRSQKSCWYLLRIDTTMRLCAQQPVKQDRTSV